MTVGSRLATGEGEESLLPVAPFVTTVDPNDDTPAAGAARGAADRRRVAAGDSSS
jgi:hypothetical protein